MVIGFGEVAAQLERRARERREEEQRLEKNFSGQARAPSEATDVALGEVETLRAELKVAREKEAKARGEAEMAREKEAKAHKEAEMARREVEAAQGRKLDKTSTGCCSML